MVLHQVITAFIRAVTALEVVVMVLKQVQQYFCSGASMVGRKLRDLLSFSTIAPTTITAYLIVLLAGFWEATK